MVDAKRVDAERRLADSEASRRQLQQQVTHFEASARRALSCARMCLLLFVYFSQFLFCEFLSFLLSLSRV